MKKQMNQQLQRFEELCRERGLRLTHQRLEIFRILAEDETHPSVEDIYRRVSKVMPTISMDTVYRTIATFEEYGLVSRVHLGNKARFDPNVTPHHHLICTHCRKVVDFEWPSFEKLKAPRATEGWELTGNRHVQLRGLCPACRKKASRKRAS